MLPLTVILGYLKLILYSDEAIRKALGQCEQRYPVQQALTSCMHNVKPHKGNAGEVPSILGSSLRSVTLTSKTPSTLTLS